MKYYTRHDLSNADYHARHELSSSQVKKFIQTDPYYYHHYYEQDKVTGSPAMEFGSLVHEMVLEPDTLDATIVPDSVRKNSNDWKEYAKEGLPLYRESIWNKARRLSDAVADNPDAKAILDGAVIESSVVWTDEETGLDLRARADILRGNSVVDLKTCQNLDYFNRDCFNYLYHVQAAHYLTGFGKTYWFFIVVETDPPYRCQVLELEPEDLEYGRGIWREAVNRLAECVHSGIWPRVSMPTDVIIRPKWLADE